MINRLVLLEWFLVFGYFVILDPFGELLEGIRLMAK